MSFYNTGNPVPSIDPRDLDDNAKHIDDLVNSTELTFFDRLGTTRKTLAGIEADADAATLRSDLAADDGSTLVYDKQAGGTTYKREIKGKLDALASVKDYGTSVGSGVASDHLAAVAMGAALGYIHFSRGNYVLNTCTLDYPVSFDKKANVTVNAGQTVTIRAAITSPKQYILKGTGTYVLAQNDAAAGEDVREVHASWFGAFPSVVNAGDQAPFIHKGFASMGNSRESIMHFDVGGYVISSKATITRGGWIKCAGSRRTVFKFDGDGYVGFDDTSAGLAKITGCNFELIPGTVTSRTSPFVSFIGNAIEIDDVRLGETAKGIVVTGSSPKITNIAAAYGADKGAGSDIIHIKSGNGAVIQNVNLATSSSFGPEAIVRVGGTGAGGINDVNISKLYYMTPSVGVIVQAFDDNISNIIVDGVQYNGFAGTPPAQMISVQTTGSANIDGLNLDKIQGSSRSIAMVTLQQGSSGSMRRVVIDGVQDKRTDGNGIELIQTAGVLDDVTIGGGVQLRTRTTPVYRSGTLGEIRVAPGVEKDSVPVISKFANIADDAVYILQLGKSVFAATITVTTQNGTTLNYGLYAAKAAATPNVVAISQSATMATALTALTGTTGTDGKITLGVTNGVLYLENRSGVVINVAIGVTGQ